MKQLSLMSWKYHNCSFQNKLLIQYFVLIFIPLMLLSFLVYRSNQQTLQTQTESFARLYLQQGADKLNDELERSASVSQLVAINTNMHTSLENAQFPMSFSEEYDRIQAIKDAVNLIEVQYPDATIRIYIDSRFRYSRNRELFFDLDELTGETWYAEMLDHHLTTTALPIYDFYKPLQAELRQASVLTLIRSQSDFNQILGAVAVDISEQDLTDILSDCIYTEQSAAFLVDSSGEVILNQGWSAAEVADSIAGWLSEAAEDDMSINQHGAYLVGYSAPLFADWRVVTVLSMSEMLAPSRQIRNQLFIYAIFIGIVAYILAWLYALPNTRRIKRLAHQIKQIEQGNLSELNVVDSSDELGDLQNSVNYMARRITTLLEEQYNMGQNLQKMEMKALQAQFNPHFLYNTLDLIIWKVRQNSQDEAAELIRKLARYYRISLSNGRETITLQAEFEHVALYVDIQNTRFEKSITLLEDLEPDLNSYGIPKLILQPLVENCILHGILNKEDQTGWIKIQAKKAPGGISLSVSDNGVGIEPSRLKEMQTLILGAEKNLQQSTGSNNHFGLLNTVSRLQAYYGDSLHIELSSQPQQGVQIHFYLPLEQNGRLAHPSSGDTQPVHY